jgi:integrase
LTSFKNTFSTKKTWYNVGTELGGGSKMEWLKSRFPGVRYREHETRFHGRIKDRYYQIRFTCNGFTNNDGLGWSSDKMTADKANEIRSKFKRNARLGIKPRSVKEQKELTTAEEKAKTLQEKIEKKENVVFDDFFYNEYLEQQKRNVKSKSWKSNESLYRLWCKEHIGNKKLKDITSNFIEDIKNDLLDSKRSPRTIKYAIGTISQVYNEARKKLNYIYLDPTLKVKLPKIENKKYRYFTKEESRLLLVALKKKSQNIHDISLFSLHTGARAGECFNLKWFDINFELKQILFRRTKNKKSRTGYMTPHIEAMLLDRYKNQDPDGYIFLSKTKEKINEVSDSFEKVVNELGLNNNITDKYYKATFHTLRHTFASWHVINGTPIYVLQKLMGHSTIQLTERYAHLAPENTETATKNFIKALE